LLSFIDGPDAVKVRTRGSARPILPTWFLAAEGHSSQCTPSFRNDWCNLMRRANHKPLLAALLAIAALSAVATEVAAHARVKRANPAAGGAVTAQAAPTELQVWFTEALEPALSTIEVVDRAGTRMDRGDVRIDPDDHTQLRVTLLPLPPGQYRVIWRVVSIDTHFRSGSFPFRVDP
jgi:methionine-rich copper-binding protein CopC